MSAVRLMLVLVALAGCSTFSGHSRRESPPASFMTMLGNDTVSAEQYSRTRDVISGDYVTRSGGTLITHYEIKVDANNRPLRIDLSQKRSDGSPAPNGIRSLVAVFTTDSATVTTTRDSAVTRRFAARDAFPVFSGAMVFYDLVFQRLRSTGQDTMGVQLLPLAAARLPAPSQLALPTRTSARLWAAGYVQHVQLDDAGHVIALSGRETTQKTEVRRVSPFDLGLIAAAFARADERGAGLGVVASRRDTTRARIGRATIWIDYGRPRARGRPVFTNGVLGDTIWRTGANAATQFRTDVDLQVGGQLLPAGTYTLWTAVARNNSRYELIFNKQVGQWGTEYRREQDLVRVPLTVTRLDSVVDEFRIDVRAHDSGGELALLWGNTKLSVLFTMR